MKQSSEVHKSPVLMLPVKMIGKALKGSQFIVFTNLSSSKLILCFSDYNVLLICSIIKISIEVYVTVHAKKINLVFSICRLIMKNRAKTFILKSYKNSSSDRFVFSKQNETSINYRIIELGIFRVIKFNN